MHNHAADEHAYQNHIKIFYQQHDNVLIGYGLISAGLQSPCKQCLKWLESTFFDILFSGLRIPLVFKQAGFKLVWMDRSLGKAGGGIRMTDLNATLVNAGVYQVVLMDGGTGIFLWHYFMREVSNRRVTGDAVWCIRITVFYRLPVEGVAERADWF